MRIALRYITLIIIVLPLTWGRTRAASTPDSIAAAQLLDSIELLQRSENNTTVLNFIERTIALYDSLSLQQLQQSARLKRGSTLCDMGRYTEALKCFMALLKEEEQSGDSLAQAQLLNHIGATYCQKGDYPASLNYYYKALAIFQGLRNERGKARIYNNIGIIHLYNNQIDKALKFYMQAYDINKATNNKRGINITLINIGEAYRKKNDHANALKYYDQALEAAQQINDLEIIGNVYLEAAQINIIDKKLQFALPCLRQAIEAFNKIENTTRIAECEIVYGDYFLAMRQPTLAITHLNKAVEISQKVNQTDWYTTALKRLSEAYEMAGNNTLALSYHKKYATMRDSIHTSQHTRNLIEAELTYEFNSQMEQSRLAQEHAQRQLLLDMEHNRAIRRISAFVILTLLMSIISIIVLLRESRKRNKRLLSLMAEVSDKNNNLIHHQNEIREQRDEIERKNKTLIRSKRLISEKNHQMLNSMEHALSIQLALLPRASMLTRTFDDHLLVYKPKDIVSGDFYWLHQQGDILTVAVLDCMGHGIPGAFMSLIGNTLMNQIVSSETESTPAGIIASLDKHLHDLLHQNTNNRMISSIDLGVLSINRRTSKALYAGANRPLIFIQQGELNVIKCTPRSAGGIAPKRTIEFTNTDISIDTDTYFYMTTDGFMDQMNMRHRKLGWQNFSTSLQKMHSRPMQTQQELLLNQLNEHRQGQAQTDDICILGFKIKPTHKFALI